MNVYERIQILRKIHLKMTQEEFASKIKISRANLGSIEVGRINVTDRVISDICSEFSVSEEWLRTGKGEMFVANDESIISDVAAQYHLEELDKEVLKIFLELPPEKRKRLKRFAFELIDVVLSNDLLRTEFQNQYMDNDTLLFVTDGGAEAAKIPEPAETGANEIKVFRAASSETDEKPEIRNESRDRISALKAAGKVTSDENL